MIKKITLIALLTLSFGAVAQTLKFGHVKFYDVVTVMPEYTKAQADLKTLEKKYADEIQMYSQEFQRKYEEFMQKADSLPVNIKERRQKEIQDLATKGQEFEAQVQQDLQKAQNDMTAPIFKKAEDAIKSVGEAEGFIYIFDLSRTAIPFVNEAQSTDVTQLVKTKLGIK